jgi:hypothetical protein
MKSRRGGRRCPRCKRSPSGTKIATTALPRTLRHWLRLSRPPRGSKAWSLDSHDSRIRPGPS